MRIRGIALATLALFSALPSPLHAQEEPPPQPVTVSEPAIEQLPEVEGTGLCAASVIPKDRPAQVFLPDFIGGTNGLIDDPTKHRDGEPRLDYVIRTLLDLSNNNTAGDPDNPRSFGDFRSLSPDCMPGGCSFPWDDRLRNTEIPFGSRLRGFLVVTEALARQPVHIGFYTDDAASLTFYDGITTVKSVMTRPPELGLPTWRLTNTVTFEKPGLYPIEIHHAEIAEHAALEMSYFVGEFRDFHRAADEPPVVKLNDAGFTVFQPTQFFQTLFGSPSFPDLNQCLQCERRFVGHGGNNGCPGSYYCNEAALCAPCDTAFYCGEECSPCKGDTPFCINTNAGRECGQCRTSEDCRDGFVCDPETHECKEEYECNIDPDCPRGEICVEHSCVPCDTADRCAGNSCNCCPNGISGAQMNCAAVEPGGVAMCVECLTDDECPAGKKCHTPTGHCVDEIPSNAQPNCCGEGCVDCMHPEDPNDPQSPPVPFCLPGPVGTACAACRNDMDCADGQYCLSGECKECVKDRRCGPRCESCAGDTPYCMGQFSELAVCVRCTSDEQCAGTTCNRETHECDPGCMATCAEDTPHCDGEKCVECYADTQCPCGNTCDLATNTCDISCKSNLDCLGNEHCRWTDEADAKECALGPMPDNVACGGTLADICSVSVVGQKGADPRAAGLVALAALALLERKRRQRSGGAS
ncbi:outer membrane exchange protein TraA family protein [Sorangium sp. So ce375]|uniref:outer membrane exchange protein TraA family protein n=1 Tax=Sorangium sp. So ce375 TaxID=3133306 RepID=UPI003F5B821C